ncbi:MAG TPA: poly-gamma-glutamate biosynthesis protein PgsC/CapC [Tissierellaceae bacterium]|nr:poly-gamma-glutamate biosynthesis protein PgsC/CapC [Tissierellaceae bacterium]
MNLSDFYVFLTLGVVISLLVEEFVGVSTGGMIVPGVLASNMGNLDILIYIFLLSFITYFIVEKVLSKHIILYGKRKFTFMIVVAMLLKLAGDQLYPLLPFAAVGFRGVGAISPALLANTYTKQGLEFTIPAALISMFVVYIIMSLIYLI